MKKFPTGRYGRQTLTFHAAPFRAPLRAFAALVFAWEGDRVLVCDIVDRGWSVPSGRVEPNESSVEAVRREAIEEAGAVLDSVQYIGCYRITERNEVRWADCYAATIRELVEITVKTESRGRDFFSFDDLREKYHLWNLLTQMVFEHSQAVLRRASEVAGD